MTYSLFGNKPLTPEDFPVQPMASMDSLISSLGPMNFSAGPGGKRSFLDGLLGGTDADGSKFNGWGNMALGGAQALGNAWMGMKQYGLAKDTFNENKRQFALNFGAQQKMTNNRLADRQAARVASNANAYQSVGDYMKQYGV